MERRAPLQLQLRDGARMAVDDNGHRGMARHAGGLDLRTDRLVVVGPGGLVAARTQDWPPIGVERTPLPEGRLIAEERRALTKPTCVDPVPVGVQPSPGRAHEDLSPLLGRSTCLAMAPNSSERLCRVDLPKDTCDGGRGCRHADLVGEDVVAEIDPYGGKHVCERRSALGPELRPQHGVVASGAAANVTPVVLLIVLEGGCLGVQPRPRVEHREVQ